MILLIWLVTCSTLLAFVQVINIKSFILKKLISRHIFCLGAVTADAEDSDEDGPLSAHPPELMFEEDLALLQWHVGFALELPKDVKQSEQQTAVNAPQSKCKGTSWVS